LRSLDGLKPADLRSFYARAFSPGRSVLIVVGDVKADDALAEVEKRFGGWAGTSVAPPVLPSAPGGKTRIVLVDKPGAAQSEIEIGRVGIARTAPDYFPVQVMNTILGGPFTSRLNQNLREAHGYAYGAFSSFAARRGAGPFEAEAAVQTPSTAPALQEMFNEIHRIVAEKPSEADLTKAKNYLALSFPQTLETSGDLARRLATIFVYGLPEDYYDRFVANVEAVDADQVWKGAKETLDGGFAVVIVGDVAKIRPEIEKLHLAPIELAKYDPATGNVVRVK
jgi:zinc protease